MNVNSISIGNVLSFKDKYWIVLKTNHVKPGKGGAFVQVEMKDIINGTKLNERFRSTDTVEKVTIDETVLQYQYNEGEALALMNMETFETTSLSKELIEEQSLPFLQEGMDVTVEYCENIPIKIHLPETVIMEIKETEPTVKGQTAAASYKPAILENGARVMVPPFVTSEDKIVVRTTDATYVERAK